MIFHYQQILQNLITKTNIISHFYLILLVFLESNNDPKNTYQNNTFNSRKLFQTPVYGDVRKIMTGYLILPPSEGVTDDNSWANPMGKRIVLAFGKPLCTEQIVVREENKYWKYELVNFQQSSFFHQ